MFIHSKRSHRSIAKIEGTLINTEHITYSFSVSATTAWLSNYRRAAGPALHPDGFFSSTQCVFSPQRSGGLFIEIVRHAVRSGLSSWMRKTCFQATMTASMTTGCNPANNRFLFSFPAGVCALIFKNNQIKKRDFLSYISMYGSQIMRASSPICSPSM